MDLKLPFACHFDASNDLNYLRFSPNYVKCYSLSEVMSYFIGQNTQATIFDMKNCISADW